MDILLKWKIWRIEADLKRLIRNLGIKPIVWSFGAYYIDPKYMVFVAGVQTDKEKEELKADKDIQEQMTKLLDKHHWPIEAKRHVHFDIESQETVDREDNGNWWYHYK